MTMLVSSTLDTPVGTLTLVGGDAGLRAVLWPVDDPSRAGLDDIPAAGEHAVLAATARQLSEWFAGDRQDFDLPLDLQGTAFQREVWEALVAIPFGRTTSYGQLASELGRHGGARAVGAAVGRNPVSVVVPCHRVVGADGRLTGFAGGTDAKSFLLRHERSTTAMTLL